MYLDPGHGSWGNLPKDPVHLKKKKKKQQKKCFQWDIYFVLFTATTWFLSSLSSMYLFSDHSCFARC